MKIQRILAAILCLCMLVPLGGCAGDPKEKIEIVVPEDLTIRQEDLRSEDGVQFVDSQLVLVAKEGTGYNTVKRLVKKAGGEIIGYISFSGDYHIDFPKGKTYGELTALIDSWSSEEFVERVSLHRVFYGQTQSVDYQKDSWQITGQDATTVAWSQFPPAGSNWWAEAIRMPDVWDMDIWDNLPAEPVKIGIIDGAFDLTHEDLDSVFAEAWFNVGTKQHHGTSMAGLIAAEIGNGTAIAGVSACSKPKLYGFAMSGIKNWEGTSLQNMVYSDVIFKYAIALMLEQGVKAINCSLGNDIMIYAAQYLTGEKHTRTLEVLNDFNSSMTDFLKQAIAAGFDFLIMKSGGNSSGKIWYEDKDEENPFGYLFDKNNADPNGPVCSANYEIFCSITDPAVRSHIIAVGAAEPEYLSLLSSGSGYVRSIFSCIDCDVYAPGTGILSLGTGGKATCANNGTSQAAAIVTGVAGLIWAVNPSLTAQQVKQIILASASYQVPQYDALFPVKDPSDYVTIVDAAFAVRVAQAMTGDAQRGEVTVSSVTGYVYTRTEAEDGTEEIIPLEETEVILTAADGTETKVKTSKWGSFDVFVTPGEYTATVDADGYYLFEDTFTLTDDGAVYLRMELEPIPPVTDAYHCHAPSYELPGGIHFYIPRVNSHGSPATEVNEEIFDELIGYTRTSISSDRGMNYLWAQKDDIISLLVLTGEDYNSVMSQFFVYNVSAETGKLLPDSALWEAFGLTQEEYMTRLKGVISGYYSSINTSGAPDNFQQLVAQSLSPENLTAAKPYVDKNGDLCAVVKIYTDAGAGFYHFLYNLTGDKKPSRPEYTLHPDTCAKGTYEQFLKNGCYQHLVSTGTKAEGYAILDIDGDGVEELILDIGTFSPEFHDHLIYTTDETGKITYAGSVYSYHCVRHSPDLGALGYIYPRDAMVTLYHCSTLEEGVLYESRALCNDRSTGTYKIQEYDSLGNETASLGDAKEEYEDLMATFRDISWEALPG